VENFRTETLVTNVFYSVGVGTDQTLINDIFDVKTSKVETQPISSGRDAKGFGEHAMYLLHNFDLWTTDFDTAYYGFFYTPPEFKRISFVDDTTNFFSDQRTHSWQNRRRRDHKDFGLSTYFQYNPYNNMQIVLGGESRFWRGNRISECWHLNFSDLVFDDRMASLTQGDPYARKLQNLYDYNTEVTNFSLFGRSSFQPIESITIQAGGQFNYSKMKVIENPIPFFDFGTMQYFEDVLLRSSADQVDSTGNLRFSEADYQRTYKYFTPWIGSNWNFTRNMNLFFNFATAQKEPTILSWYDFDKGPLFQQRDGKKLNHETAVSFEFGMGFRSHHLRTKANYYRTQYRDKIESVLEFNERINTINAGKALFQGIEFELESEIGRFDFSGSATLSKNRWQKMEVQQIFNANAKDVEGKVVPFLPERMFNASIGYRFTVHQDHHYRAGVDINYWDRYYGTYTNSYMKADGTVASAALPYFLDIGAHLSFTKSFSKCDLTFRLDANNILNRKDNFMRAQYTIDYGRTDEVNGKYHLYVLQAPLLNIFLTTEIALH